MPQPRSVSRRSYFAVLDGIDRGGNTMISKNSMRKMWLCSVPALLTSVALIAQAPPSGGAPSGPGGQQPGPPRPPPDNPGVPPGGNTAEPTGQTLGDQALVPRALEGGRAEVQPGQF